jgi:hypothetical protein
MLLGKVDRTQKYAQSLQRRGIFMFHIAFIVFSNTDSGMRRQILLNKKDQPGMTDPENTN